MHVRFHGFRLKTSAVSLSDFFEKYLPNLGDEEIDYRGQHRLIYVGETSDHYAGLLLTARDQRSFCELNKSGGKHAAKFKVNVRKLTGPNRLAEFNFFIVNKKTGRGFYQHYRGSCGLTTFGFFLKKLYDDVLKELKEAEIKEWEDRDGKTKAMREIREKYKLGLDVSYVFKPEDFANLVKTMRDIRSLSFSFETFSQKEPWLMPLRDTVASERHTVSFSKNGPLRKIKTAITSALSKNQYERMSVSGLDEEGNGVTYQVASNIESFDTCDFDTITVESALDITSVSTSPIVDRLIHIAKKYPN